MHEHSFVSKTRKQRFHWSW